LSQYFGGLLPRFVARYRPNPQVTAQALDGAEALSDLLERGAADIALHHVVADYVDEEHIAQVLAIRAPHLGTRPVAHRVRGKDFA